MATLLHLDSSPLASSVSRELGREFLTKWKAAYADGTVIYRDLAVSAPKPVDQTWIYAAYTPVDSLSPEQKSALAVSEELIGELNKADEYLIDVAMHNFSIPSTLKLWIDQVARKGKTFEYGESGPKGLLQGKKATVLVATGGSYDQDTPYAAYNFIEPYLKAVLGFWGVTDVTFVTAGGTSTLMTPGTDRGEFLAPTLEKVRELVTA